MKKKSQMELMGIAIIVVIISLVMVFVVNYMAHRKPTEYRQEFAASELATNIVKTLLSTTAPDCLGITFNEIFQDCIEGPRIVCDDGNNSCDYAEHKTAIILNETLGKWDIAHEFKITLFNEEEMKVNECPGKPRSRKTKPYPIQTDMGTMNVLLYICYY
jgi:hypothetical protein